MAKFDTSLIEGFDSMTAEEKLAALLDAELPDVTELNSNLEKYKGLVTKYTGEISELKKTQSKGLSEAEKKAQESESKYDALLQKFEELEKEAAISKNKAKYIALGYSEELAEDTAKALADGDFEKLFTNSEKYKAELEKSVKAQVLKDTPHPNGKDTGTKPKTKDEIMKIKDSVERQKAIADNIQLFIERKQ